MRGVNMKKSKVSYLVLSDIHLGHPRIITGYIINNLHNYFAKNNSLFKKLDIIFLAGDIYDKLLSSSSKDFILINEWLSCIAMYCKKNNIKLRILEGTPSHDWRQASVFSTTIEKLGVDIDYRYINEITIEYMEDLGIDVLYIPDEINPKADQTLNEVKSLLDVRGINKVDIGIFHGQFHYQLPMVKLSSSHDEESYLNIVRYYINIGHIHTSSAYGRILAQGSFDRLAHNEEEAKGGMVMNIYCSGDMDFIFIPNPNAFPHITYDVSDIDISSIVKFLDKKLNKVKLGTRVRIIFNNSDVIAMLKPLMSKYEDIEFTMVRKKSNETPKISDNKVVIEPFEINKDNILSLMREAVVNTGMSGLAVDIIIKELKEVMKRIK